MYDCPNCQQAMNESAKIDDPDEKLVLVIYRCDTCDMDLVTRIYDESAPE
jgi:predicted SprT family Zn-dependent metalloprotease